MYGNMLLRRLARAAPLSSAMQCTVAGVHNAGCNSCTALANSSTYAYLMVYDLLLRARAAQPLHAAGVYAGYCISSMSCCCLRACYGEVLL